MSKKNDHSLGYITLGVVITHLLLFLVINIQSDRTKIPPPPKEQIIVQTIQIGDPSIYEISQIEVDEIAYEPPQDEEMVEALTEEEEIPQEIAEEPAAEEAPPEPTPPAPAPKPAVPQPKPQPPKPKPIPPPKPKPKPKPEVKKPEKPKTTEKEKPKEVKKPVVKKEDKKPKETKTADANKKPAKPKPEPAPVVAAVDPKVEAAKAAAKAKQQELMKLAKERLANIDKTAHKLTSSNIADNVKISGPGRIEKLEIEAMPAGGSAGSTTLTAPEASYRSELIHRLKLLLRLPEFGEVKVQLTLERSGQVAKVTIVSAESSANRKYIEKTLPTANFPGFGENFLGQSQYTFLITLSNDI